jgi:hypothetical protein
MRQWKRQWYTFPIASLILDEIDEGENNRVGDIAIGIYKGEGRLARMTFITH